MKRTSKIVKSSMGNFLSPPNHPNHFFSVQLDTNSRAENRGYVSIEYAAYDCEGLDKQTKIEAIKLINDWQDNKLPINDLITQQWIEDCKSHLGSRYMDYISKYYDNYSTTN